MSTTRFNTAALSSTADQHALDSQRGPLRATDVAQAYKNFKFVSEALVQHIELQNMVAGPSTTRNVIDNPSEGKVPITVNFASSEQLSHNDAQLTKSAQSGATAHIRIFRPISNPLTLTSGTKEYPSIVVQTKVGETKTIPAITPSNYDSSIENVLNAQIEFRFGVSKVDSENLFTMTYRQYLESLASDVVSIMRDVQRDLHSRLAATGSAMTYIRNLRRYSPDRFAAAIDRLEVLRSPDGDPIIDSVGMPSSQAETIINNIVNLADFKEFI